MACLHARVGVPRWLTAATISLGIVFSVWLCLVIPSAAPKQRIRALVIKTEKPSAALAKAKEAEACSKACEAAGVDPSTVVSVVRVDLPPSYGDMRPASPAPSYKSEMGVPASPAPSYRSVAPGKEDAAGGEIDMFQCSGLFLPLLHNQHCIENAWSQFKPRLLHQSSLVFTYPPLTDCPAVLEPVHKDTKESLA